MSKEKENKIEDTNVNEQIDEMLNENQEEQAQTGNLSADQGHDTESTAETEELDP